MLQFLFGVCACIRASVRICPDHNLYINAWIYKKFTFRILCKRKFHLSYPLSPPPPPPPPPQPTHTYAPTKKIIHLCIMFVNDLIRFGGHCDLYIMVQRFCCVSLTISNRKTAYRSLKQTVGSTSCLDNQTTLLVLPV